MITDTPKEKFDKTLLLLKSKYITPPKKVLKNLLAIFIASAAVSWIWLIVFPISIPFDVENPDAFSGFINKSVFMILLSILVFAYVTTNIIKIIKYYRESRNALSLMSTEMLESIKNRKQ